MAVLRTFVLSASLLLAACLAHAEPLGLSGVYKTEGGGKDESFMMKFEGDQCSAIGPAGEVAKTQCLRQGNLLYIAPIVPKGQRMTRNVWVVYTIFDDRLESSHVEDMDSGDIFYKDQKPKIVLKKQAP